MSAKERIKRYGKDVIISTQELTQADIVNIAESDLCGYGEEDIFQKVKRKPISICFNIDNEFMTTQKRPTHSIEEFRIIFGFEQPENLKISESNIDIQKLQSSLMRRDGGEFKIYELYGWVLFGRVDDEPRQWYKRELEYCIFPVGVSSNYDLIPRKIFIV